MLLKLKCLAKKFALLQLLTLCLCLHHTQDYAYAQYFTGPIASGVGMAGRASTEVSETTFLNPAVIAHAPPFSTGFFYSDGYTATGEHDNLLGLNLVDNSDDVMFPGAFGYIDRRRTFVGQPAVDDTLWHISLGNFLFKQVALGFSFLRLESNIEGGKNHKQWNGVVGMHFNPSPDLGFGLIYYHFAKPADDVPVHIQLLPKWMAGMTWVAHKYVRLRLDGGQIRRFNDEKKWEVGFGIESQFSEFSIFRLGYKLDDLQDRRYVTLGYTLDGPRFKLDYSFVKNVEKTNGALHSVDLRFPL